MTVGMIDANLLTLWIVGQVSEVEVPRCRRTRAYSITDYRLLAGYVSRFDQLLILPNIATQASDLLGVLHGEYLTRARQILAAGLAVWNEQYVASAQASAWPDYARLGLTDAAILLSAVRETEVLTDDFELYRSLSERGVRATNFTHIRSQTWD